MPASAHTLDALVPWRDVKDNLLAAKLLHALGFDQLDVGIQASAGGDPAHTRELRAALAGLASIAGIQGLKEAVRLLEDKEKQKRKVSDNQVLGRQVQEFVKQALIRHRKGAKLIDRGYDFGVYERGDADVETDFGRFEVEGFKYLVEVKAARTDEVRLTPLQAAYRS